MVFLAKYTRDVTHTHSIVALTLQHRVTANEEAQPSSPEIQLSVRVPFIVVTM